jgi:hypothetical protein
MGKSRLKGGRSQDWLPHMVSSYLPDATLVERDGDDPSNCVTGMQSRLSFLIWRVFTVLYGGFRYSADGHTECNVN